MEQGGLGLRRMLKTNKALVAKLGWKLLSSPNSLWAQTTKLKYKLHGLEDFSRVRSGVSWVWHCITRVVSQLFSRLCILPRKGVDVSLQYDSWVPNSQNFRPIWRDRGAEDVLIQVVSDFVNLVSGQWVSNWSRGSFRKALLRILLGCLFHILTLKIGGSRSLILHVIFQ